MMYGWQIEDLEKKLSEALQHTGEEFIAKQKVYTEMLEDYRSIEPSSDYSVSKSQFISTMENIDLSRYLSLDSSIVFYLGELFRYKDFKLPEVSLEGYSLEQTVEKARIFVRRLDHDGYQFSKKILNSKNRVNMVRMNPYITFLGKCYIIDRKEVYILINSVNGVQDTITLLHELRHVEDYMKPENNRIRFYELGPITREHFAFDFMEGYEDSDAVNNVRAISLYHYLARAIRLCETMEIAMSIKENNTIEYISREYEPFTRDVDVNSIHKLLSTDFEAEIDYVLSFIASLDIYLNCNAKEAPFFVSMYQSGMWQLNCKVVDRIAPYLMEAIYKKPSSKYKD